MSSEIYIPGWTNDEMKNNGSKFELVPEGETTLTVLDVRPVTFASGKNGIIFECEDNQGRQIRHQCFNDIDKNGKFNRWMLKNTLEALCESQKEGANAIIYPKRIIGKKFNAIIKHGLYFSDKHQKEFPRAEIVELIQPEQVSPAEQASPGQSGFDDLPEVGPQDESAPF